MLSSSLILVYLSCGVFFLTGLLTGVWKFYHIHKSSDSQAPEYVNIAHRASLLYSFAALVLAEFVKMSSFSETVNFWSAALPLFFFAFAIITYILHGLLLDTDNQFKKPHKLGKATLPPWLVTGSTILLIVGEVGGFGVLFIGFLKGVFFE